MAAGGRRPAVTLPAVLILVCVLVATAPGLQMLLDEDPSTYPECRPREFWYRRGEVVVIDLGNTNSCVAGYTGSGKTTDDDTMFQFCIPSWVAFTDNGTSLVGEAAKNHAAANPEATIFGFKRLLGLRRNRWYDEDIVQGAIQRVPYKIGTRDYDTAIVQVTASDGSVKQLEFSEVASMVVAELKNKAEEYLGRTVEYAVMTIPQHFAAAHSGAAEFQVFGYRMDNFLGGDDFDDRVVDYFAKRIKLKHGVDISQDRIGLGKLRAACENAKKALSSQDHVQVIVESLVDGVDFSEPLSRSEFEELNDDLFRKVMNLVETAMVNRGGIKWSKSKIGEIVMVGGSAVIPRIQNLVRDYFDGREPNIRRKPDEAMALGAALYVHSL
ncbi:unnamed protein product [Miscanthus lutarioriparius]|uniref:Uncharacterized protein n=1 Tax=Miscanthus lutarioriparius TaxID=422564 RepID=A0A811SPU5_9POAL|nr:unnamed protein product [Miscanthus lutarioriparius]